MQWTSQEHLSLFSGRRLLPRDLQEDQKWPVTESPTLQSKQKFPVRLLIYLIIDPLPTYSSPLLESLRRLTSTECLLPARVPAAAMHIMSRRMTIILGHTSLCRPGNQNRVGFRASASFAYCFGRPERKFSRRSGESSLLPLFLALTNWAP